MQRLRAAYPIPMGRPALRANAHRDSQAKSLGAAVHTVALAPQRLAPVLLSHLPMAMSSSPMEISTAA